MELLKNQKKLSECFTACLKFRLRFERFGKEDDPHSLCISEIIEYERRV